MKYSRYPKRDAIKNYFPLPKEIFLLSLKPGELAVYAYLLYCEDRNTYQCWPSYRTIGNAVKLSENTVRKCVSSLVERGLVTTEPTSIRMRDGRKRNGSLLYTIRPIQEALDRFHEWQLDQAEMAAAKQRAAAKLAPVRPCEPLCGALEGEASTYPSEDKTSEFEPLLDEGRKTAIGLPPKPSEAGSVGKGGAA